jgi:DNA polymerase-3 subunit epsilon
MKFAIVDIETTGSKPGSGRITEVAIYLHDGEKIINEFCSLINPESFIPPFISKLTGISNEMVENAPKFHEIAKEIVQITEGAVFVAHNAAFDYNFIRQEFKSLGFNYARDYFCTLQVSRQILPGLPSYSLGKLCSSLNIEIENRHRAHGDALATVRLFEHLCGKTSNKITISDFIKNDYLNLRFPPGFNKSIMDTLPVNAGVYYFHDSNGNVIYIGKSNNIRKRVLSHFNNKKSRRQIDMRNAISDISFEETGNELIALLLESEEIKKQKPFRNLFEAG